MDGKTIKTFKTSTFTFKNNVLHNSSFFLHFLKNPFLNFKISTQIFYSPIYSTDDPFWLLKFRKSRMLWEPDFSLFLCHWFPISFICHKCDTRLSRNFICQLRSTGMQACWLGCHGFGRSEIKSAFDGSDTSVASKEPFLSHFCHIIVNLVTWQD